MGHIIHSWLEFLGTVRHVSWEYLTRFLPCCKSKSFQPPFPPGHCPFPFWPWSGPDMTMDDQLPNRQTALPSDIRWHPWRSGPVHGELLSQQCCQQLSLADFAALLVHGEASRCGCCPQLWCSSQNHRNNAKQLFTCGAKCPSRTCGLQNFKLESNLQRYSRLLCKRTLPVSLQAFFSRSLRVILALPYGTSCEIHDPAIFDTYPVKLIRLGLHNPRGKVDIAGHLAVSRLAHPSQNHNQHIISLWFYSANHMCRSYVILDSFLPDLSGSGSFTVEDALVILSRVCEHSLIVHEPLRSPW